MTTEARRCSSWAARIGWAPAAVVLLPVLYVLASGPTFWPALKTTDGGITADPTLDLWNMAYDPLVWLGQRWEPFGECWDWYLSLPY
jgi:hypothetical protein